MLQIKKIQKQKEVENKQKQKDISLESRQHRNTEVNLIVTS